MARVDISKGKNNIMLSLPIYRISRNIDNDLNLAIWRTHQDCQVNLRHYQSIYTTSMGFSPHRTEICQFKILPTAFSEQTAKYNVCQYSVHMVFAIVCDFVRCEFLASR